MVKFHFIILIKSLIRNLWATRDFKNISWIQIICVFNINQLVIQSSLFHTQIYIIINILWIPNTYVYNIATILSRRWQSSVSYAENIVFRANLFVYQLWLTCTPTHLNIILLFIFNFVLSFVWNSEQPAGWTTTLWQVLCKPWSSECH